MQQGFTWGDETACCASFTYHEMQTLIAFFLCYTVKEIPS